MRDLVINRLEESIEIKKALKNQASEIINISQEIIKAIRNGGKVILFGNGGSAADAQHIAAEFVGKFMVEREAIPAMALTTNTSILTAIANDIDFNQIFSRQIEAIATEKDLVIGISTSGMSINVIKGVQKAKEKGAKTVALTGQDGSELVKTADMSIKVPSKSTPRIQEAHIIIGHIICELVEQRLSND